MEIIDKGIGMVKDVKAYWKKPKDGRYMPYREIAAYSIGGIGAYSIFTMAQQLLLSTTNVIIGNTIGILPMHMYIMYVISVITNIPLTMVRANMVDNVKYKEGKYRPYLLRMGIPTVLVSMLFVFTPYSKVPYIVRCILIFIYNFGLQFFYNFFYDAYENLIHVLSPNTQERADATAVKSVIYSLSPTITNFVTPLIAGAVANGNIYDLRVYQWLYPFIAIVGVGLIILVYARTEEKIIVAKNHTMKVRFMDALREVAKNKYFWIISLAGWVGFLETATYVVLQWLYNYGHLCTDAEYAFITFIKGSAYSWGMIFCPWFIRKMGKKKLLIATNIFNVMALALVYPLMHNIWTVLFCFYLNSIADSFLIVLNPTIQADIRDYQQYKSGERIDGMFGAVAMIGGFITMATSSVLPAVYQKYGIYDGNGYENMYDILYDTDVLFRLVGILVILSAVGAALNVVPYFFYDFTEVKQRAVVKILQIRARIEDFGDGVITDEELADTQKMVADAKSAIAKGKVDAKALKGNKKEYKEAVAHNEDVEISAALINELEHFESESAKVRLKIAEITVEKGIYGIADADDSILQMAIELPANTKEEKQLKKEAVADAKSVIRCKKETLKRYPEGITVFDEDEFNKAYDANKQLSEKKVELMKQISAAKKEKSGDLASLNAELKQISAELSKNAAEIAVMDKEYERYAICTKAYNDSVKLLKQAANYAKFRELEVAEDL